MVSGCGMLLNHLQLSLWSWQPQSWAQWAPLYRMYISLWSASIYEVLAYISQINLSRDLSFCCSQMLCLVSRAKMNMRFYLKCPINFYFSFQSFKMFMWTAWMYGCGTKAFVSLAEMNDMWATATVAIISAIKYKKQRTVMTDAGGSQSPVTVYLKSTVMRRNVFDCMATAMSS